jgi:hypothetical protein
MNVFAFEPFGYFFDTSSAPEYSFFSIIHFAELVEDPGSACP